MPHANNISGSFIIVKQYIYIYKHCLAEFHISHRCSIKYIPYYTFYNRLFSICILLFLSGGLSIVLF